LCGYCLHVMSLPVTERILAKVVFYRQPFQTSEEKSQK
jgi:hypothetical protein